MNAHVFSESLHYSENRLPHYEDTGKGRLGQTNDRMGGGVIENQNYPWGELNHKL